MYVSQVSHTDLLLPPPHSTVHKHTHSLPKSSVMRHESAAIVVMVRKTTVLSFTRPCEPLAGKKGVSERRSWGAGVAAAMVTRQRYGKTLCPQPQCSR